jgi:uncharacterized protein GlcG (DUF336 family)
LAALAGAALAPASAVAQALSEAEVGAVVREAALEAARLGLPATIAVVDGEGNALAVFRMDGAPVASVVEGQPARPVAGGCGEQGLEGLALPAELAALSKAGTGALLSSTGHAFSTRTAAFVVQQNFPPGVELTPGGAFFGLLLSSLPCTDVPGAALPLGLSGDPGGQPLYRRGVVVGGVGVEGDGRTGIDLDPVDADLPPEEQAALAGARAFAAPAAIRAESVLLDGIRLPFANGETPAPASPEAPRPPGVDLLAPRGALPSRLLPAGLAAYPTRAGAALSQAEVARILDQAARQTLTTSAAIRRPLRTFVRVNVAVVDAGGDVLGFFRNEDAPLFGIDAAVQKARTAAFFSGPGAAAVLGAAGLGRYLRDGLPFDGSVAYTSRAVGFLAQPFFPPGIVGTEPGPFSVGPPPEWSPFHPGLQLDLVCEALAASWARAGAGACTPIPGLGNGIALHAGGVPLYKDGRLAGAIGVSGDGPDQDDLVASAGVVGFEAPPERRCDRLTARGVRLPYVKFPRHPER